MPTFEENGRRYLYTPNETINLNFGKLAERTADANDPRIAILRRFATTIFLERNDRFPEPEENINLRHADDIAVAAMFEVDYPDITPKTMTLLEGLGVTPDPHENPNDQA
jgi:hypothetical protein